MGKYPLYIETPVPQRGEDQIINKEYHDIVVFDDEGFIVKFRWISMLGAVLLRLLRLLRFVF